MTKTFVIVILILKMRGSFPTGFTGSFFHCFTRMKKAAMLQHGGPFLSYFIKNTIALSYTLTSGLLQLQNKPLPPLPCTAVFEQDG